jgi:cyclopropane fatty-acyl-phospholipid synthase-like methyltransferase
MSDRRVVTGDERGIEFFDQAYLGIPPWDIGRAQPPLVELAEAGKLHSPVLDVGCGTGENALYLAGRGLDVTGIDAAPRAIAKARQKAEQRGMKVDFEVVDALTLSSLGRTFRTAIDSGLFHVFSDNERPVFARELHAVLQLGGTYYLMCFSEYQPGDWGPRRVTQAEIRETFSDGWEVGPIRSAGFETNLGPAAAWLASVRRL